MMMPAENAERGERCQGPPSTLAGSDAVGLRPRVRSALVAVVAEHGYANTTLEQVLERAEVEPAAFDRHFAGFDALVVEIWQGFARDFLKRSDAAFAQGVDWRDGMRRQAWDLCRFVEEDLGRIRLMVELPLTEELVQAERDLVMSHLADLVHLGRLEREEAAGVPRATAEGLIGAIWNGVARSIRDPDFETLHMGVPQMLYLTMLAYLGQEAGEEELRRGAEDIGRFQRGEI